RTFGTDGRAGENSAAACLRKARCAGRKGAAAVNDTCPSGRVGLRRRRRRDAFWPLCRASLQIKQPENLAGGETERRIVIVTLAQHACEQIPLLLQHLVDLLFDRVLADEFRHDDLALAADAMRAVDRLILDSGVPPAVVQEDISRELQVES